MGKFPVGTPKSRVIYDFNPVLSHGPIFYLPFGKCYSFVHKRLYLRGGTFP